MLQNVAVYPIEKDVFYREHDDGTYGVEAFLAQYITLEVPFEIGTSLVFCRFDRSCGWLAEDAADVLCVLFQLLLHC